MKFPIYKGLKLFKDEYEKIEKIMEKRKDSMSGTKFAGILRFCINYTYDNFIKNGKN